MATGRTSEVIEHLRTAVLLRHGAGQTDGQLLEDYISRHDQAALAALVRRHAPMIWGVCRRVLLNYHDVEDAFQATFLVFVRKAASIASRELLANWLYGVAHQTALKARATAAKRNVRERQVTEMPEPAVADQDLWNDLRPLIDQELSRLAGLAGGVFARRQNPRPGTRCRGQVLGRADRRGEGPSDRWRQSPHQNRPIARVLSGRQTSGRRQKLRRYRCVGDATGRQQG
jgi:RNA polymerase sigma factor (sigma-70 family)